MTWVEKTKQSETWALQTGETSIWVEKTEQGETWAPGSSNRPRVFSPLVFSIWPLFATGVSSDFWTEQTKQSEAWAEA